MHRLVIDTNVYIDWLNEGGYEAILFQRDAVKYLSAIVMMELLAGAFSGRDRKMIHGLVSVFVRTGRILLPSRSVYEAAGHVLCVLQQSQGDNPVGARSLTNDVLIALSARTIGATVVTQNKRDFAAIQRIHPFKAVFIE
jgi:predicted nucleic acid-binding protein